MKTEHYHCDWCKWECLRTELTQIKWHVGEYGVTFKEHNKQVCQRCLKAFLKAIDDVIELCIREHKTGLDD